MFKPVEDVTGENFADIRQFHRGHHGVVYIRTAFDAAKAAKGELLYGADGPVRVWVNGRAVGCVPGATNPAVAGAHRAAAAWKKGVNEIVFGLLTNQGRAWGVFASVRAGKAAKRG